MKSVTSKYFNTKDIDLNGDEHEENISSYKFIFDAGRKLLQHLGYEINNGNKLDERTKFAGEALKDFADTLKALVKEEMLQEMRERIKNIETFYR